MGNFMDTGFHGLAFTHAILNHDFFIYTAVKSLCPALNLVKTDRYRGNIPDRLHKYLIVFHTSHQLRRSQFRKRLPVSLGYIKYRSDPEAWDCIFHFLHLRRPIRLQHRLQRRRINLLHFFLFPDRRRGNDLDAFLPTLHLTMELFLPCLITSH